MGDRNRQSIFVFEYVLGGGLLADNHSDSEQPPESLRREGAAMLGALVDDFANSSDCRVRWLRDARWNDVSRHSDSALEVRDDVSALDGFRRLAGESNWTVVIAPEFDGILARWCDIAVEAGGRLLGPSAALVRLAADKLRTTEWLKRNKLPVPGGVAIAEGRPLPKDFSYPAVLKPIDGAGSMDAVLVEHYEPVRRDRPFLLEPYCAGTTASVAVLCGPGEDKILPPCRQLISSDGQLSYLGGEIPLSSAESQRAGSLAARAVATLRGRLGYIGLDMILGKAPNGDDDRILEINPRLTTSYVGLRQYCRENLAAAMLAVAEGRPAALSYRDGAVTFDASGTARLVSNKDSD